MRLQNRSHGGSAFMPCADELESACLDRRGEKRRGRMPVICSAQHKAEQQGSHFQALSNTRMCLPRGVPRRLGRGRPCGLGSSASAWGAAGRDRGSPSLQVVVRRPGVQLLDARGNEEGEEVPVVCVCSGWCRGVSAGVMCVVVDKDAQRHGARLLPRSTPAQPLTAAITPPQPARSWWWCLYVCGVLRCVVL